MSTGNNSVTFEVLVAVVMKSSIFWDITPCSPLKENPRFGGTLWGAVYKNDGKRIPEICLK
jgi:hypothetical protein